MASNPGHTVFFAPSLALMFEMHRIWRHSCKRCETLHGIYVDVDVEYTYVEYTYNTVTHYIGMYLTLEGNNTKEKVWM